MTRPRAVNEIKIALGITGDIWPMEIYGAVAMACMEDAEKQHRSAVAGLIGERATLN